MKAPFPESQLGVCPSAAGDLRVPWREAREEGRGHLVAPHARSPHYPPPWLGCHLLSSAGTQALEIARCHPLTPGTSLSACQCLEGHRWV